MSVIIHGMEMPRSCQDYCPLMHSWIDSHQCEATGERFFYAEYMNERPDWCPLEEVQEDDCK